MPKREQIALIVIGLVVVLWAALTWLVFRAPFFSHSLSAISAQEGVSTTESQDGTISSGKTSPDAPIVITFPSRGIQWIVGETSTIRWSKAAGVTGGIYLVDATTGAEGGWIVGSILPDQTAVAWNGREVFPTRSSRLGKAIPPGNYVMKIKFDLPKAPSPASATFSLVRPPVEIVSITRASFSSSLLDVFRGTKIQFTNDDVVPYQISVSGAGGFTVRGASSYTFDTAPLAPGSYLFNSGSLSSLRMTVNVRQLGN
jgi:hypothetical protein